MKVGGLGMGRFAALAVAVCCAVSASAGAYVFEADFSEKDERNRAYGIDIEENTSSAHGHGRVADGRYEIVGQTLDDAAGEAFDKAAKLLGLGYPGGPVIDREAQKYEGNDFIPFPKGRPRPGTAALAGLDADLCTSFSGLKTSLLNYVKSVRNEDGSVPDVPRICASYRKAIVEAIAERTEAALRRRRYRALIVGGGVSLNGTLREALKRVAADAGVELLLAKPKYCGDNAAMIAGLAYYRQGVSGEDAINADVQPSLEAGDGSLETARSTGSVMI